MSDLQYALFLGVASGLLAVGSFRYRLLGWLALAPLGVAVAELPPGWAGLSGAIAGALTNSREIADRTMRVFGVLAALISAAVWAAGFALAAFLMPPPPVWLALVLPVTVLLVHLPLRLVGTPRWHSNPLAHAQVGTLPVVHTAKLGGDLAPTGLLALTGAAVAVLAIDPTLAPASLLGVSICLLVVTAFLFFGRQSFNISVRRAEASPSVRVAAVVANGARPNGELTGTWPVESPAYRDVPATVERYEPLVREAAQAGAELVLLPEVCVVVNQDSRARFIGAVAGWAKAYRVVVVAPFFDESIPKNELVVIDNAGTVLSRYEKQHPVASVEGKREKRMTPGPIRLAVGDRELALSTVICVDLDYADLVKPVRAAGGILLAPSNDWPEFDELHHRSAVWSAVTTGVSVVRATGWGISAVFDGAGRVLARAASHEGPVVLTADVPVTERADTAGVRNPVVAATLTLAG